MVYVKHLVILQHLASDFETNTMKPYPVVKCNTGSSNVWLLIQYYNLEFLPTEGKSSNHCGRLSLPSIS